jgi:phosphinothricin acetyltransferase
MAYIFEEMSAIHRQAVIDIFNHFITESHAAFLGEAVDYPFFDHFVKMAHGYPALVVTAGHGQVVGFGFMRPHHIADSFKRAAEVTYFALPEYTRQGLGTALLDFSLGRPGK